jgi:hypothetical protein
MSSMLCPNFGKYLRWQKQLNILFKKNLFVDILHHRYKLRTDIEYLLAFLVEV